VCPDKTSGEPAVPDAGDQSTPVISSRVKSRSMTPFEDVSEVKCMMLPFGSACCRGAPGDAYVNRPTVNTSGSTHMVTAFMGLTSSHDVTASGTVST
jgi:hypothetical protein